MGPKPEGFYTRPEVSKAIHRVKRQIRKRWWGTYFDAHRDFTSTDTDQIVDDVVFAVSRGDLKWEYGPLEAVLLYWSHKRAINVIAQVERRKKLYRKATGTAIPLKPPGNEETSDVEDKAERLWRSTLPTQDAVTIRHDAVKLCRGHTNEAILLDIVLTYPGLIAAKNFRAQEIREEFQSRDVDLTIAQVHETIENLRKILRPLAPVPKAKSGTRLSA